jgi:hypothetical protein
VSRICRVSSETVKTLDVYGKRLLLSYTAELRRKKRWLHNAIGNAEHPTSHIKYRSRLTVCRRRRDDRALMNIRVVFCVIVCGLVLTFVGRAGGDPPAQSHSQRVFKVGVLASLTGSWSSLGQNTVAALQIAKEQLEAEAISHHGGYRFQFLSATRSSILRRRLKRSRTSTSAASRSSSVRNRAQKWL